MAGQQKQTTRSRKIEPLNWADTANSPALKGMVSFLDIKPEEVRSGHFKAVPTSNGNVGGEPMLLPNAPEDTKPRTAITEPVSTVIELQPLHSRVKPKPVTHDTPTLDEQAPESESETRTGSVTLTASEALPVSDARTGSETHTGSVQLPDGVVYGSHPSQNRKIRKCRFSQDAHSSGEEALYRILWDGGKAETANPLGSRIAQIGYAELAFKARMHKANVRLNLASLVAKLAIEQIGDFSSLNMIAKTYRVLSYKEILDRRRAAGLEYVVRSKSVAFVTVTGEPISLPGLPNKAKRGGSKSAGYDQAKSNKESFEGETRTGSVSSTVSETRTGSVSQTGSASYPSTETYEADLRRVAEALNKYWTVDDAAAEQLLRACRAVRSDATADEIAFFVAEKLEATRTNRSINNPVGLILAVVPQSFHGYSFETFRTRRQESLRLAKEEKARKEEEERHLREWILQDARKTLANPDSSPKRRAEAEHMIAAYDEATTTTEEL